MFCERERAKAAKNQASGGPPRGGGVGHTGETFFTQIMDAPRYTSKTASAENSGNAAVGSLDRTGSLADLRMPTCISESGYLLCFVELLDDANTELSEVYLERRCRRRRSRRGTARVSRRVIADAVR